MRGILFSGLIGLLMKKDSHRHTKAQSVAYGLATFKNNSKLADVLPDYKKIEGESQQVYYAAKTMSAEQLTLAALHKAWPSRSSTFSSTICVA